MLRNKEDFWKYERDAPLLNKNRSYLKADESNADLIARVEKWPSLMGESSLPSFGDSFKNFQIQGEPDRIIIKDAERTFFGDHDRQLLIQVLSFVQSKFDDYAQGLSYVVSFLLLHLDVNTVVDVVGRINFEDKYLPGYWKTESVASAIDANVFEHLLERFNPAVRHHLSKNTIFPETYAQKWFVGLGIHVLPFDAAYLFFENFLRIGYKFLFQFAFSLIDHLQDSILKTNSHNEIYELLRLNAKLAEDMAVSMVQKASTYNIDDVDFKALRSKIYEEKLRARMEAAQKAREEAEDDSIDLDDDDDDEGEGTECGVCLESVADFFCPTCNVPICENCDEESKGSHKRKQHKLKKIEDVDVTALLNGMDSMSIKKD